jgi:hypothetical protein
MGIFMDYIGATVFYNLQILPETLMTGIIVLAILLMNQSLVFLAAGAAGTQLLARAVGRIMMNMNPEQTHITTSLDNCTGGFIGKSWERLLGLDPDALWHPRAPSVYLATLGFFAGYGGAVQQLYKEEIDAGVVGRHTLIATSIISILLLLLAVAFRYFSGCETFLGAAGGLALGLAIGYFGAIALGFATDRRATNIWGIPLLRDRINNGSAVYVCPK